MPWDVKKRGNRWCVVKKGASSPVPGGCHGTRAEAVRHQRALYAGESSTIKEAVMATTGKPDGTPMVVHVPQDQLSNFTWVVPVSNTGYGFDYHWTTGGTGTVDAVQFNIVPAEVEDEVEYDEEDVWEAILAVEGKVTSDKRYLMKGEISHRELPLTLMMQTVTEEGHKGAEVAGKITSIDREERPDLGEGVVAHVGRGVFAKTAKGREAYELNEDKVLRGVSIDFAPTASYLLDPETLEVVNEEELDLMDLLGGDFVRGFAGDIMGATLCPFPAFEDATMHIIEAGDRVVVACAFPFRRVLTASAAGLAPLMPPKDFFYQPEPDGPFPLTVMPDGRVMGHLAVWNQCHRTMQHSCELAPRSKSNYAYFHTGAITCENGEKVNVGRMTVGGGHASVSPYLGTDGAVKHYDDSGTVAAYVRAVDGTHGIWLSGVIRSDAPAELVRDLEANPPSGDWREEKGRLELCAVLGVPVPGFPVPRYEAALVASGEQERVVALVASGYAPEEGELSRSDQRRIETLKAEARRRLAA